MKMEDSNDENRKRVRENDSSDSDVDSPESKIPRVDSDPEVDSPESHLTRVDSGDSCLNSGEWVDSDNAALDSVQDDLFNLLDDQDNATERDPTIQGLDSVIKSFEEEILASGPDAVAPTTLPHESGEMQPNLGYLLEASDDELGLPPTVTPSEERKPENEESGRVGPEGIDLTGFLGFEDDIPNYEAFEFEPGMLAQCDSAAENGGAGGFVTVDGLFDYSEPGDILWRPESLQAM